MPGQPEHRADLSTQSPPPIPAISFMTLKLPDRLQDTEHWLLACLPIRHGCCMSSPPECHFLRDSAFPIAPWCVGVRFVCPGQGKKTRPWRPLKLVKSQPTQTRTIMLRSVISRSALVARLSPFVSRSLSSSTALQCSSAARRTVASPLLHPTPAAPPPMALALSQARGMKVRSSVKLFCDGCKVVKRKGAIRVICSKDPKHKQVCNAHLELAAHTTDMPLLCFADFRDKDKRRGMLFDQDSCLNTSLKMLL